MGILKRYPAVFLGLGITLLFGIFGLVEHSVWSRVNMEIVREPSWGTAAEFLMILIIGLLIAFVFPRLKGMISGIAFAGLLMLLIGTSTYFFVSKGLWIRATYPLLQLTFGYIGVLSMKYLVGETHTEKKEGTASETNRQLGISYQSQGLLDMAFEEFCRMPVDDDMKGLLYNLGLDFERKQQFDKASEVYDFIEEHDSEFKDIHERKKKLIQTSSTMVFGDAAASPGREVELSTGTDGSSTLGRYQIVKMLGKGAMGTVYLGQDPRIHRTTAIKTFPLGEDLQPEEVENLKEKFFREAESAGTLSHPNIVTIYDAGEEKNLAYIAMEYLEGDDFTKYTNKNSLLPMRKIIDCVAGIADGLDYAHQAGIVHRDIKPANIMLLKTDIAKITDFGIARITATSKTQIGVVKGTPYYMSPEQISGEKVDGRSDLFSLGGMLYQLLTGELPFHGENPAALMNQIMNVPNPDPRKANPKIVKPLVTIINKTLEKDREKRYQRGSHLAGHLRELGKRLDAAAAKKKEQATTG